MKTKVKNLANNQLIIQTENSVLFQSYDSIICKIENGQTYLDERFWDYSKTTGKYRNIFLGEGKKETTKKINSGEYKLTNLN